MSGTRSRTSRMDLSTAGDEWLRARALLKPDDQLQLTEAVRTFYY